MYMYMFAQNSLDKIMETDWQNWLFCCILVKFVIELATTGQ